MRPSRKGVSTLKNAADKLLQSPFVIWNPGASQLQWVWANTNPSLWLILPAGSTNIPSDIVLGCPGNLRAVGTSLHGSFHMIGTDADYTLRTAWSNVFVIP